MTESKLKKCYKTIKTIPKCNQKLSITGLIDILEETIKNLGLKERPDLIWNMDESGAPHEPKKCNIVSLKGQPTLQI